MQSRYLRDFDAQLSFMVKDLLLVRHCHFLQWGERLWYNFGTQLRGNTHHARFKPIYSPLVGKVYTFGPTTFGMWSYDYRLTRFGDTVWPKELQDEEEVKTFDPRSICPRGVRFSLEWEIGPTMYSIDLLYGPVLQFSLRIAQIQIYGHEGSRRTFFNKMGHSRRQAQVLVLKLSSPSPIAEHKDITATVAP